MGEAGNIVVEYDASTWFMIPQDEELAGAYPDLSAWADAVADAVLADGDDGNVHHAALCDAVLQLAQTESDEQPSWSFLHVPTPDSEIIPAHVFVWSADGLDPAESSVFLASVAGADDPLAVEAPVVEPFTSRGLGQGVRVLRYVVADEDRHVMAGIRYAWHLPQEHVVELRAASLDVGRLLHMRDDLDRLADSIRTEPDAIPGGRK